MTEGAQVQPSRDSPLRIEIPGLREATVISRPNRFVALVRLGDREVLSHVADSGRLKELIFPGNRVMVREAGTGAAAAAHSSAHLSTSGNPSAKSRGSARKTPYDLILASAPAGGLDPGSRRIWVSVNTRYPNLLLGQALRAGAIPEFDSGEVAPEYWYHHLSPWKEEAEREDAERRARKANAAADAPVRSRMDFYLGGNSRNRSCLVEVKSVTLCRDGVGYFPDAPTDRGTRHLRELTRGSNEGYRACAVFVAQREDVEVIKPNREMDPAFAGALVEALESGVRLLGYRCFVSPDGIRLAPASVPVIARD